MPWRPGSWRLREFYDYGYFPIAGTVWLLGAFGVLPRVRPSTRNEGHERRYFYGSVWAVAIAQPVLWLLWKVVPVSRGGDALKLLRLRRHPRRRSATSRGSASCRARVRSCRASGPSTDAMTAAIDVLTAPTLKHVRDLWWDDTFTEFLAETLRPRPGNRILDVGCGEGQAEVSIGRLQVSQVRLVGVDLVPAKAAEALRETRSHNQRVSVAAGDACRLPFRSGVVRRHVLRGGAAVRQQRERRDRRDRARDRAGAARRDRGARQRRAATCTARCRRERWRWQAATRFFAARGRQPASGATHPAVGPRVPSLLATCRHRSRWTSACSR